MNTGTIKFYNEDKGYGFIKDNHSGEELFFHITELKSSNVQKDDEVNYQVANGRKGPNAVNVTLV